MRLGHAGAAAWLRHAGAAALVSASSHTGTCDATSMADHACMSPTMTVLAVVGALIGAISFSGSVIAWAKLDGRMDKRYTFPAQQMVNAALMAGAVLSGVLIAAAAATAAFSGRRAMGDDVVRAVKEDW